MGVLDARLGPQVELRKSYCKRRVILQAQGNNAPHYEGQPLIDGADGFANLSPNILPIQHGDHTCWDIRGTDSLTSIVVGAVAKSFLLHGADHVTGATLALGLPLGEKPEVGDLGADKEHGRAIGAGSSTGSTADTGGGIHGGVGDRLWDQ